MKALNNYILYFKGVLYRGCSKTQVEIRIEVLFLYFKNNFTLLLFKNIKIT